VSEEYPTGYKYVLIRYDLYHIEGVLCGSYLELDKAQHAQRAFAKKAKREGSFLKQTKATFIVFERMEEDGTGTAKD
jgi:hypothetical protein